MQNEKPLVIDDREGGVFRVHRSVFTEASVLERERAEIFDKSWVFVGHESELAKPNDFLTRKVAGREIIFNRDGKGKVHVLLNTCRHRGAMACRTKCGNQKVFTCFYHGWGYDTTGALVAIPDSASYAPAWDKKQLGLHEPRNESYRGFVFVTFSADTLALDEYLGDAKTELDLIADQSLDGMEVLGGAHQYAMNANWKLLVENSVDGYHGLPVHQTFAEMQINLGGYSGLVDLADGTMPFSAGIDLGNGHATTAGSGLGVPLMNERVKAEAIERRKAIAAKLGEAKASEMFDKSGNRIFFPNFIIVDLSFGIQLRTMYPVAPGRTEITGWQLMPKGVSEETRRYRIDNALTFWGPAGFATPDDVEALEQCQRGFTSMKEVEYSDISRGMKLESPRGTDEVQMRAFWREWNHRITGAPRGAREAKPRSAMTPRKNAADAGRPRTMAAEGGE